MLTNTSDNYDIKPHHVEVIAKKNTLVRVSQRTRVANELRIVSLIFPLNYLRFFCLRLVFFILSPKNKATSEQHNDNGDRNE